MCSARQVGRDVPAAIVLLMALLYGFVAHRVSRRDGSLAPTTIAARALRTPFERALRAASYHRMKAKLIANQDREALAAWDPNAFCNRTSGYDDPERWRLDRMAADRSGDLRRASSLAS